MAKIWSKLREKLFPLSDRRSQCMSCKEGDSIAEFAYYLEQSQESSPEVAQYMVENSEIIEADLDDRMTLEAWRKIHRIAWLLSDARQTESLTRVARVEEMARDCAEQCLGRHAQPILKALNL